MFFASIYCVDLIHVGRNRTIPFVALKQALALEEGIIALLGRGFEVAAVVIMTLYGVKALQIGLHDSSLFVEFFFRVMLFAMPPRARTMPY